MSTPLERSDPERIIARFADVCADDARISAAFVGGSIARGASDPFSDLDLCVVAGEETFDDVFADRERLVEQLGRPLFLEVWGDESPEVFSILADGTDIELFFVRERELPAAEVGPIRPLLDRGGLLDGLEVPMQEPSVESLTQDARDVLAWFWHDVAHLATALGRDQRWWAHGQVEALRGHCVNLVRLQHRLPREPEPYWKIDAHLPPEDLDPLRHTIVAPDRPALAQAGVDLVSFFGMRGRDVATTYGVAYPEELERVMRGVLDEVRAALG